MASEPPSRCAAPERLRRLRGPAAAAIDSIPRQQFPGRDGCNFARLAVHLLGLAFGLALAVRPLGWQSLRGQRRSAGASRAAGR